MSAPENPSAFPLAVPGDCLTQPTDGMTLRDYFAGQALAGIMAHDVAYGRIYQGAEHLIAGYAYSLADAMLAERTKGGEA